MKRCDRQGEALTIANQHMSERSQTVTLLQTVCDDRAVPTSGDPSYGDVCPATERHGKRPVGAIL